MLFPVSSAAFVVSSLVVLARAAKWNPYAAILTQIEYSCLADIDPTTIGQIPWSLDWLTLEDNALYLHRIKPRSWQMTSGLESQHRQ